MLTPSSSLSPAINSPSQTEKKLGMRRPLPWWLPKRAAACWTGCSEAREHLCSRSGGAKLRGRGVTTATLTLSEPSPVAAAVIELIYSLFCRFGTQTFQANFQPTSVVQDQANTTSMKPVHHSPRPGVAPQPLNPEMAGKPPRISCWRKKKERSRCTIVNFWAIIWPTLVTPDVPPRPKDSSHYWLQTPINSHGSLPCHLPKKIQKISAIYLIPRSFRRSHRRPSSSLTSGPPWPINLGGRWALLSSGHTARQRCTKAYGSRQARIRCRVHQFLIFQIH